MALRCRWFAVRGVPVRIISVHVAARLKARRRGCLLLASARKRDTVQAADLRFQVEWVTASGKSALGGTRIPNLLARK
jgi:hypothetical protein